MNFYISLINFIKVFIISILLISCESNRWDIDISEIHNDLKVQRFDQDLLKMKKPNHQQVVVELKNEYGDFFDRYVNDIISVSSADSLMLSNNINMFLNDPSMKEVFEKTQSVYVDLNDFEQQIIPAFSRYKYHFADKNIPNIITYVSGFNYALAVSDDYIGVGLDMFLGKDCVFYPRLGIPNYKSSWMTPQRLPIDLMKGWLITEFESTQQDEANLLAKMIYEGKILMLLDAFFPTLDDTLKLGFTKSQLEWCKKNELNMWAHFVDNQLLFATDKKKILNYTGEGPFTTGFDKTSPAQSGNWMGWQIVKMFLNKNKQVTLKELMEIKDAQIILNQSGYKPR
jgi:hypothetical protein